MKDAPAILKHFALCAPAEIWNRIVKYRDWRRRTTGLKVSHQEAILELVRSALQSFERVLASTASAVMQEDLPPAPPAPTVTAPPPPPPPAAAAMPSTPPAPLTPVAPARQVAAAAVQIPVPQPQLKGRG